MNNSIAKSIIKNTSVMFGAQGVTWISGFILLLFLPRYLGSEGFGKLYLAMSIQLICQWVIDYGGQNYVTKEVSRNPANALELMGNSATLRVGLWLLSTVVTYLLCVIAHYSPSVTLIVMLLAVSNLWTNMTGLLRFGFQGFEEMKYPSIGAIVERSFLMLTVVPALLLGAKENVVVILMSVSTLFSFGISLKYIKRFFQFKLTAHLPTIKRLLRDGLPYFLWSLFGVIYYRINSIMLSVMTPESVVGWYGAAFRFFDILMFLPAIYSQALYPILTKLSVSERNSMKTASQKSLEFLMLAGIPIAVMLIFFAKIVIQILFGLRQFGPSVTVLQFFSLGMLLVYADFVLGGTVLALDKQKQWAMIAFFAAIVNIGTNYFLISYFQTHYQNGGIGSAIATDLTELFIMLCATRLLPRGSFNSRLFPVIGKGLTAGIVMSLSIAAGNMISLPWPVVAAASLPIYISVLFLLNTFEPSEIRLLTEVLSKRRFGRALIARRGTSA